MQCYANLAIRTVFGLEGGDFGFFRRVVFERDATVTCEAYALILAFRDNMFLVTLAFATRGFLRVFTLACTGWLLIAEEKRGRHYE